METMDRMKQGAVANRATSEVIRYFVNMEAQCRMQGLACRFESAVHDEDKDCSRVMVSFRTLDAVGKELEKLCHIFRLASEITMLDDEDGTITLTLTIPDEEK